MEKHKVFISYHHENDQRYKDLLVSLNDEHEIFIDCSVKESDFDDDNVSTDTIRTRIRDEHLRDSTVTILLVGTETAKRKHVDWELSSSMINGDKNKKSGILVITLPDAIGDYPNFIAAHGEEEKKNVYPENSSWKSVSTRAEYFERYPYMPERIVDNLLCKTAKISVIPWKKITVEKLRKLIQLTFDDRESCKYDLSRKFREKNS